MWAEQNAETKRGPGEWGCLYLSQCASIPAHWNLQLMNCNNAYYTDKINFGIITIMAITTCTRDEVGMMIMIDEAAAHHS